MRTVQYIHGHILDSVIPRKTTRRRSVGQEVEETKRSAGTVELVAGVAREVEAQRLVVVEHRRVDGAVEESKDGVGRGGNEGVLNLRHDEVVVRLEDGASGHSGVIDDERFFVVVDGLDFVVAGGGLEEEVGGAVEHFRELWGAATVVDAEWVLDAHVAAEVAAEGETESRKEKE